MNLICLINQTTRTIASASVVKNIQTLSGLDLILKILTTIDIVDLIISVCPCCTHTPTTSKIIHSIISANCFHLSFSSSDLLTKHFLHFKENILGLISQSLNYCLGILQSFSTNIHLKFANTKFQFKIKTLIDNLGNKSLP